MKRLLFVALIGSSLAHASGVAVGGSGAGSGPVQYNLDGVSTEVSQDTGTPGSSRPLPVQLLNDAGAVYGASNPLAVSATSLPLPTGAATSAKQDTGNTSLSSIDGKITAVNTGAVVISSSALPSGAATSANQATANTSLSSIDGKLPTTLGQKTKANSLAVTLASDQGSVSVSSVGAATGSVCSDTTVSTTAESCTAPASAVGFLIQASSSNTQNVRFAVGTTASATVGLRLEPGRSEYVPIGANISYASEASSGQEVQVQWIAQ